MSLWLERQKEEFIPNPEQTKNKLQNVCNTLSNL